jgi:transcriptional regulator with AAA-type ATPase domain
MKIKKYRRKIMPRKPTPINELKNKNLTSENETEKNNENNTGEESEVENLSQMLASVLSYLSDEEIEEIDLEYLLNHTKGLREWWEHYLENNRKQIEKEIKQSLSSLSMKDLENIKKMISEKNP